MMIASVYNLNRTDWKSIGLKDAYGLHKAVYDLFPKIEGETRDFLFSDKGGDWQARQILILSERYPNEPEHGTIKSISIPESFLEHERYGFEVTLNPSKRDVRTRKTIAIRGAENLLAWFTAKAPACGFSVLAESLQVQDVSVRRFDKGGTVCTHNSATFVGKLEVIDRAMFIRSFKRGVGRAKGFGFGLLQITPLQV